MTQRIPAQIPSPRELTTQPRRSDQVFRAIVTLGGMASLAILGLIAIFLSIKGLHILQEEKFGFITKSNWEVITDENGYVIQKNFGIAAMLIGTFLCALIAVIVGVPISVLSALYLTFYAKGRVKSFLISLVDLMAAFPSLLSYRDWETDRKSTHLNSSHEFVSRMPSSA